MTTKENSNDGKLVVGLEKYNQFRRTTLRLYEDTPIATPHTILLEMLAVKNVDLFTVEQLDVLDELMSNFSDIEDFREALQAKIKELRK